MQYFESLVDQLTKRAARATLGQFGLRSKPLREFLWQSFSQAPGKEGAFLADPVFEATFGWKPHTETMADLAGGLLDKAIVHAMANPPKELREDYQFEKHWAPYSHQHEAWSHLLQHSPKSVMVSSGTGSGKTECFLVPILNDIVTRESQPDGVEALFLYPLNALINSQRERLTAWTHQLGSQVKFCLFNGDTPEAVSAEERKLHPNEQLSRKELRENPAQILVTNSTMLEYMLVRQKDASILKRSQGKLRWIVLDEAHTYIGSQAAELSLLLRRVMHGFGVTPDQVRFVATSATIGGEDSDGELKAFLADVAGVDISQVHLVKGQREIKPLKALEQVKAMDLVHVNAIEDELQRYDYLSALPPLRTLRQHLSTTDNRMTLSAISKLLSATDEPLSEAETLKWMDICAGTKDVNGEAFIPFRLHIFHRVASGLWACSNKDCKAKAGTPLESLDWRFGMVSMSRRESCSCGSPMFEMVSCNGCGTSLLATNVKTAADSGDTFLHLTKPDSAIDDFALDIAGEDDDVSSYEDEEEGEQYDRFGLISPLPGDETGEYWLDNQRKATTAKSEGGFLIHRVEGYRNSLGALSLRCPCCQQTKVKNFEFFRYFKNGAPFMLSTVIPTLLEYCQDGKKEQKKGPWNGRRMITFTDSRQGTARFSAKSQQDAERQFLRSTLFHLILDKAIRESGSGSPESAELEKYKKMLDMAKMSEDEDMVEFVESKIASLVGASSKPVSVSWSDAEDFLADQKEVQLWIKKFYEHFDDRMEMVTHPKLLARLLLLREFNSRPKRQNTLETMGLVAMEYPLLAQKANTAPKEWLRFFDDVEKGRTEWVTFLTLAVNFHVRSLKAVRLTKEQLNWIGAKYQPTLLVAQGESTHIWNVESWPKVTRGGSIQPRLARLLSCAFNIDLDEAYNRAEVNEILRQAWNALQSSVLTPSGDGFRLELEQQVSFSLLKEKNQCPHTQKIIDKPLLGITPYLNASGEREEQLCRRLLTPDYPYPFGRDPKTGESVELAKTREWQEQDALIDIRKENAWSDIADRVIERTPYFRVAEHSAQLKASQLRQYEKDFKEGRINVLSCSTTMEMGVDIGGISVVAMNNAPPNPANYLQRAGRAGRRGESKSIALTLCKSTPHGEHIFSNTRWAFDTQIKVPNVSLSSEYIVRRHVNSLLLSTFLNKVVSSENNLKLNCGTFFKAGHELTASYAEQFIDWCREEAQEMVQSGLDTLLLRTALEANSRVEVLNTAAKHLETIMSRWTAEHQLLLEQSKSLADNPNVLSTAQAAVESQIQRLEGEFLLSDLARKGFLPGYGFPTDVVSLNTDHAKEIERRKRKIKEKLDNVDDNTSRKDNLYSAGGFPSRDLSVAIRDYAPGNDVVIDGRVYQSAGVLLNWHSPASADQVKEIQALRWAWRCDQCGASNTSTLRPERCECCGNEFLFGDEKSKDLIHPYIQPASFAVDIRSEPHNDISRLNHVPFNDPWVTVDGKEWQHVSVNPSAAYRSSHNGHIYYYSGGPTNVGYALCLECGRMEAMPEQGNKSPKEVLVNHYRLRGGKGPLATAGELYCGGNEREFTIKGPLKLGHSTFTDVFELILFNDLGHPLVDRTIARSISVLIRNQLAEKLGINSDEIGCTTKPVNFEGREVQAVVLFDNAAGGAGFAIQASEHLVELLQGAKKVAAHCSCDKACHRCLVDYSTQHVLELLDRRKVASYLSIDFFRNLALPDEYQIFASNNRRELRPLTTAIEKALSKLSEAELYLTLPKKQLDELGDWTLYHAFNRWVEGRRVNIVLAESGDEELTIQQKVLLNWYVNHPNVKLYSVQTPPLSNGVLLASVVDDTKAYQWGYFSNDAETLICGTDSFNKPTLFDSSRLSFEGGSLKKVVVHEELNGAAKDFGFKFWSHVFKHSPELMALMKSQQLQSATYSDRYLAAPLPLSLCFSALKFIGEHYMGCTTQVVTGELTRSAKPRTVQDNFEDEYSRDKVFRLIAEATEANISFRSRPKYELPHARVLELVFDSGTKVTLWLDQGFGYWYADKYLPENQLERDVSEEELADIISAGHSIIRSGKFSTDIFVSLS
ncbi:TPA: DEAD/DEAH box helicase [Vibrio cholerae]|nr:DEAD/DEAH box helicase [Vibrio cholerae]